MKIRSIKIEEIPTYSRKPDGATHTAAITFTGASEWKPNITINLPPELVDYVVTAVSRLVAEEFVAQATGFKEEVIASLSGPPIEQPVLVDATVIHNPDGSSTVAV